ncbi:hypothetical protein NX872_30585, partial [Burkholderia thailandensis]|uniref:hypothetical protein n=1 Tax=Burkholderia thailandensis TaxID=57975 RepID=UPI00217D8209
PIHSIETALVRPEKNGNQAARTDLAFDALGAAAGPDSRFFAVCIAHGGPKNRTKQYETARSGPAARLDGSRAKPSGIVPANAADRIDPRNTCTEKRAFHSASSIAFPFPIAIERRRCRYRVDAAIHSARNGECRGQSRERRRMSAIAAVSRRSITR